MQIVKRGTKGKRGFLKRNEEDDQPARLLCAAAVLVAPYVFRIYFWRRIFVFCIFYLLEYSDNRSASVLRSI